MQRLFPTFLLVIACITLQVGYVQGQDGLLGRIAAAPFVAAGEVVELAGGAAEEAVYVTGDVVEFAYRVHPAPRVGRFVGLLPQGKLGILPSHHEPVFPLNRVQRLLTTADLNGEGREKASGNRPPAHRAQLVLVARRVRHTRLGGVAHPGTRAAPMRLVARSVIAGSL